MKRQIVLWWIMSMIFPARLLLRLLNAPKKGGHAEAVCFLRAEPLANPKERDEPPERPGNVSEFQNCSMQKKAMHPRIVGPSFTRSDRLFTLWYPLIEGVRIVTIESIGRGQMRRADRTDTS